MEFDYKLLVKYLMDELTEEELEQLLSWRTLSEENRRMYEGVVRLRIAGKYTKYNTQDKIEDALVAMNKRIGRKPFSYRLWEAMKYAVVLALAVSGAFYGWQQTRQPEAFITIAVKEGEEVKKVQLDDGTFVWLNSASTLRIPASFSPRERRVYLEGEAFFEVKKNEASPFLVNTSSLKLKVTGTSFNIKTDADKERLEAILVSGRVILQDQKENNIFKMSPGEKVTFNEGRNEYYVETVDLNVSAAWRLRQFTFENATLREIASHLSQAYHVHINIESKRLTDRIYRCVINREESLVEVLEILSYLAPLRYRIEESEVFIYE